MLTTPARRRRGVGPPSSRSGSCACAEPRAAAATRHGRRASTRLGGRGRRRAGGARPGAAARPGRPAARPALRRGPPRRRGHRARPPARAAGQLLRPGAARRRAGRRGRRLPGGRGRARPRGAAAADRRGPARRRHGAVPPARRRRAPARPEPRFGLAADGPLVVGVSRLVPRKGFDMLIRAAARLAATRPDLVGGHRRRRPRRGRLERLAGEPARRSASSAGCPTTTCPRCTAAPTCSPCCAATAGAASSRRASASCSSRRRPPACRRWPGPAVGSAEAVVDGETDRVIDPFRDPGRGRASRAAGRPGRASPVGPAAPGGGVHLRGLADAVGGALAARDAPPGPATGPAARRPAWSATDGRSPRRRRPLLRTGSPPMPGATCRPGEPCPSGRRVGRLIGLDLRGTSCSRSPASRRGPAPPATFTPPGLAPCLVASGSDRVRPGPTRSPSVAAAPTRIGMRRPVLPRRRPRPAGRRRPLLGLAWRWRWWWRSPRRRAPVHPAGLRRPGLRYTAWPHPALPGARCAAAFCTAWPVPPARRRQAKPAAHRPGSATSPHRRRRRPDRSQVAQARRGLGPVRSSGSDLQAPRSTARRGDRVRPDGRATSPAGARAGQGIVNAMAEQAREQTTIEASVDKCYRTLSTSRRYPEWAGDLKEAKVIEHDDQGRADRGRVPGRRPWAAAPPTACSTTTRAPPTAGLGPAQRRPRARARRRLPAAAPGRPGCHRRRLRARRGRPESSPSPAS